VVVAAADVVPESGSPPLAAIAVAPPATIASAAIAALMVRGIVMDVLPVVTMDASD
jgi:hypothetical protein